jgi:hypothetical protein
MLTAYVVYALDTLKIWWLDIRLMWIRVQLAMA